MSLALHTVDRSSQMIIFFFGLQSFLGSSWLAKKVGKSSDSIYLRTRLFFPCSLGRKKDVHVLLPLIEPGRILCIHKYMLAGITMCHSVPFRVPVGGILRSPLLLRFFFFCCCCCCFFSSFSSDKHQSAALATIPVASRSLHLEVRLQRVCRFLVMFGLFMDFGGIVIFWMSVGSTVAGSFITGIHRHRYHSR